MIAKPSPLSWIHFGILKWEQQFIERPDNSKESSVFESYKDYKIDVDFSHGNIDDKTIQVFIKISINQTAEPLPGYSILIEAIGVFDTTNTSLLTEEEVKNLEVTGTTNLMISRIRGLIPLLSSQGPYGAYELPLLNLGDLIDQKIQSIDTKAELQ